jgi:transcriptional regulator with XRE-family HTH domain
MTSREIRAALILKGITQASIAEELGVSASMISQVIDGKKRSERIQHAIARAIDRPVHQVFPDEIA